MIDIVNWAKETLRLGNIAFIVVILAMSAVSLVLRPRWGRRWIVAVALAYWFVSTPLGSGILVGPLVRGYHPLESAAEAGSVGAIVVLGGGTEEYSAASDALMSLSRSTALRTLEAARVFRLLNGRPLVVASGGTPRREQRTPEAKVIADGLITLDVPADRVIVESESMNTREQALAVTRLLALKGIHRFVVVTSPTHMARSSGVFLAQDADVVPSTSPLVSDSIRRRRFFMPDEISLGLSDAALYEYAAIVYYWGRGWFRPSVEGGR